MEATKEAKRKYWREWQRKNIIKVLKRNKRWCLRHSEQVKEITRKNKLKNRECFKIYNRKWQRDNPDKIIVYNHRRRTLLQNAEGSFTEIEWKKLKKKYNYTCLKCHCKEPQIRLTPDHIIPLSKGGSNYITNIQPLCRSCNSSKRDFLWKRKKAKQNTI